MSWLSENCLLFAKIAKNTKKSLRARFLILRKIENVSRAVWAEESKTGLSFEIYFIGVIIIFRNYDINYILGLLTLRYQCCPHI